MITQKRMEEVYAKRGLGGIGSDHLTEEERGEIMELWDKMPDSTSFTDAFAVFLHPEPMPGNTDMEVRANRYRKYMV